jgi:hypothetical protein
MSILKWTRRPGPSVCWAITGSRRGQISRNRAARQRTGECRILRSTATRSGQHLSARTRLCRVPNFRKHTPSVREHRRLRRIELLFSTWCQAFGCAPQPGVVLARKLVSWGAPRANKNTIRAELFDTQSNKPRQAVSVGTPCPRVAIHAVLSPLTDLYFLSLTTSTRLATLLPIAGESVDAPKLLMEAYMTRYLYYAASLGLIALAMPLRAASRPHAGEDSQNAMVWTNDDLEKLHSLGLISIVGRIEEERPAPAPVPRPYVRTQDPEWYAAQAAKLRDELERRQTQLSEYRQAIDDVRNLRKTTGGVNLDEGDLAITPEFGIGILERHVEEVQTEISELEDLARRHDIPPGTLRGQ